MNDRRVPGSPGTLAEILCESALAYGSLPAIVAERDWSFADLDAEARAVASRLIGCGVRRGDRVALRLAPSGRAAVLLAAIAKAGASAVPLDTSTPVARLKAVAAEVGARMTVDGSAQLAELFAGDLDAPPAEGPDAVDEAYVITTSGSTGAPKGVAVSHGAIAAHARLAAKYFGVGPGDRTLQFASLGFDVSQEEIWASWVAGAAIVVNPIWLPDAHELAGLVARHEVTVLQLPTAYWRSLLAETDGLPRDAFSRVRLVVIGGEAARTTDLRAHAASALGHAELVNGYGPTETVVTSVAHRFAPGTALPEGEDVPIGTAFPGRHLAVIGPEGHVAGPGEEGELWVGGLLADGYVNRSDLTRSRFLERSEDGAWAAARRWYRTGDRVLVAPSGELVFRGRFDDQVKLRGYRIELGEIDAALRESGELRAAAAALVRRDNAEPRLGALVVPKNGFDVASLTASLGSRLPGAFVPTMWAEAHDIPLTPSGKVDRLAVGELIATAAHAATARTARTVVDETPTLEALGDVWREVLGVAEADPDGDFFLLGGDSLLAVRFSARARARGVMVKPADVVKQGTLRGIIAAAQTPTRTQPNGAAAQAQIALLPAQYRWLLDGQIADVNHFLVSALLRIEPDTPTDGLRAVASAVLRQHASLSSAFDLGGPAVRLADRTTEEVVSVVEVASLGALRETASAIKRGLDLTRGDVFRMVRLQAGRDHRLLLLVHHLVLDGWSMALLVDEVEAALERWLRTGRAELDPPTASVAAVRGAIDAYVASAQARRDARTWLDCPWEGVTALRLRSGQGLLPSVITSRSAISPGATTTIMRRLPARSARPLDLLRSSILVAVAEWTGTSTLAIDVYDNQRAAPVGGLDVSRTIGYLQSTHPELGVVTAGGTAGVLRLLAASRRSPANLFSFDALRFLSPVADERQALAGLPRSPLRLNYRSQLSRLEQRAAGSPLGDADEDTGRDRAETQTERYDLMFEGDIVDGQFVVGAKFSTDHFDAADIDALTERVAELMRSGAEALTA